MNLFEVRAKRTHAALGETFKELIDGIETFTIKGIHCYKWTDQNIREVLTVLANVLAIIQHLRSYRCHFVPTLSKDELGSSSPFQNTIEHQPEQSGSTDGSSRKVTLHHPLHLFTQALSHHIAQKLVGH